MCLLQWGHMPWARGRIQTNAYPCRDVRTLSIRWNADALANRSVFSLSNFLQNRNAMNDAKAAAV